MPRLVLIAALCLVPIAIGGGCGSSSGGSEDPALQTGACCFIDGSCFLTNGTTCAAALGTFNAGQPCTSIDCRVGTLADFKALCEQLEFVMREDLDAYLETVSIVGREYWNLNGEDSQWTDELLGRLGATIAPDSHLVTRSFLARYRAIKHAQRLVTAAGSAAGSVLTQEEANGVIGFAKTVQAWSLLMVLTRLFSNGILPLESLDNPGPANFLGYTESLQYIDDLLTEAATALTNGGAAFVFQLTMAMNGFDRPATWRQVNRALAARVRIWQGDKAGSISGIAGSFFNINGSMENGPKHYYDTQMRNPLWYEPDQDLMTVPLDFAADATPGDTNVSLRTRAYVPSLEFFVPVTLEGLTGDRQVALVDTDLHFFPMIKNSELILIYGEAQIGSDVNEALAAINRVRNASGLANYLGATDDASMLNEILRTRRYALFGLGHRWADMRRTGKLSQIPSHRVGDVVHQEFPRPDQATLDKILDL